MKTNHVPLPVCIALFSLVSLGCPNPPASQEPAAGAELSFAADGVSFTMAYVPIRTFPVSLDDSGSRTVDNAFWIGETEVTYELWSVVCAWGAAGNGYFFQNAGTMGDGSGDTDKHPVTTVSWRDALVWCNAATEWYNEKTGSNDECAYTYSNAVIRDSRDANSTACDDAVASPAAKGFRLTLFFEWELAARWRNDSTNTVSGYSAPYFTQGDSASGAIADYLDDAATQAVSWYFDNASSSTHEVGGKSANALGLYDMSGNVWELCFDYNRPGRARRGGSCLYDALDTQIGGYDGCTPGAATADMGFRLAKTR